MKEQLPTNAAPPGFVVHATVTRDQIMAGIRVVVVAAGVFTALATFLSKRDLSGLLAYIQTNDFLSAMVILSGAGSFIWGQFRTRWTKQRLITAGVAAPDSVTTVIIPPKVQAPPAAIFLALLFAGALLAPGLTSCTTAQVQSVTLDEKTAIGAEYTYQFASRTGQALVASGALDPGKYRAADVAAYEALLAVRNAYAVGNALALRTAAARLDTLAAKAVTP